MDDNDTLLAHLVPRLTERTEDTAVEALAYILSKSPASRSSTGRFAPGRWSRCWDHHQGKNPSSLSGRNTS